MNARPGDKVPAPPSQTSALASDELRRRADLLATALELEGMAAWTWDRRTDRVHVEHRASAVDFVRTGEPSLVSFLQHVHPDDRAAVESAMNTALAVPGIHRVEFRFRAPDGSERWLASTLQRYLLPGGEPAGLIGASRDITVRKRFYRDLADKEQRLRTVLETEPECVKIVDREGVLRMMNPAGLAMIGVETDESLIGHSVLGMVAPEHRVAYAACQERVLAGNTETIEFEIVDVNGRRLWVESKVAPLRDASGEVVAQLAVTRDVTERRELLEEVIEAAGREQERIGYDLHDGLGQELTGISLMLKALQGQVDRKPEELRRELDEILRLVNHALGSTRAIARGLSPVALERGGLAEALRGLIGQARERSGLRVRLSLRATGDWHPPPAVALHLYRIAQEALSNAIRHSAASQVTVTLSEAEGRIRLRIADDGQGIHGSDPAGSGLGLRIMQYRAQLIGARLDIGRAARGGTAIVVQWRPTGEAGASP